MSKASARALPRYVNWLFGICAALLAVNAGGLLFSLREPGDATSMLTLGLALNALSLLALFLFQRLVQVSFHARVAAEEALQRTRDNLESIIAERTGELSELSRHLIRTAEEEKAALAREMHDELGSNLTAINLDIAGVAQKLKNTEPQLALRLQRAIQTLKSVVELKRRIVEDLHPTTLHALGLAAAMQAHCEEFTRRTGLPCRVDIPQDLEIDPERQIALYRVAQKSLSNISKYAQATDVQINLRREAGGIRIQIIDDGIGGGQDAMMRGSHGLVALRERVSHLNGSFTVRAGEHQRGTVVEAYLPFR